jgi:hypothetical protein
LLTVFTFIFLLRLINLVYKEIISIKLIIVPDIIYQISIVWFILFAFNIFYLFKMLKLFSLVIVKCITSFYWSKKPIFFFRLYFFWTNALFLVYWFNNVLRKKLILMFKSVFLWILYWYHILITLIYFSFFRCNFYFTIIIIKFLKFNCLWIIFINLIKIFDEYISRNILI